VLVVFDLLKFLSLSIPSLYPAAIIFAETPAEQSASQAIVILLASQLLALR